MDGATFVFIVMPALGGMLAGYILKDWRLSGAVAAGGFGLLLILPGGSSALVTFLLPALLGMATGALLLLPYLRWRPDATVWGRMTVSMVAALAASFANLSIIAGAA